MSILAIIVICVAFYGGLGLIGMVAIKSWSDHDEDWESFFTATGIIAIATGIAIMIWGTMPWLGALIILANSIGVYQNGSKVLKSRMYGTDWDGPDCDYTYKEENGTVNITANGSITIKGDGTVTVDGKEVKPNQTRKVKRGLMPTKTLKTDI